MASTEPELSAFLAGHWPDARRLWFASLPAALGVIAVAWGGPWRAPGVVLVAAAAFYAGATMWQRRRLRAANARDFAQSLAIAEDFAAWEATSPSGSAGASSNASAIAGASASTNGPSSLEPALHPGLHLCNLEKDVRPQMVAAIDSWLRYTLGAGGHLGRSPGADGSSSPGATTGIATALGPPTGGSFVAVFEESGEEGPACTLHVIAPGSWWCIGCITNVARETAAPFMPGTHAYRTLVTAAITRARSFPFATGRVSARLDSMLGESAESAPQVDTVGASIGPGMILAGSFRFAGEQEWQRVFPFDILRELIQVAGKYSPVFRVTSLYGSTRPRLEILRRK